MISRVGTHWPQNKLPTLHMCREVLRKTYGQELKLKEEKYFKSVFFFVVFINSIYLVLKHYEYE